MATTAELLIELKEKITKLGEQKIDSYFFSPSTQMYYTANMEFSVAIPPRMSSCNNLITVKFLNGVKQLQTQHLYLCNNLTYLFLPKTLISIGSGTVQFNCPKLEIIELEDGFKCNNCNFSFSKLYSVVTIVNMLTALADRTGLTAYTLTLGSTNLKKLTEEQIAIATSKNWTLA